ncbi:CRAL/TRIO domain containing protein [Leishmania donovani]|nr:CRAL/TRIO domain containing protein [Leishmania donovani]VDZ47054.1 CRAL/TRIO_domain_containing_protein_putative/Pfam:PF00650 [Leishmania donovani]
MSHAPVLLDIGSGAYAHQAEVDEVKERMGIHHNYFDCWIFGFLENKNFNVDETVAKLRRRADFEREQLAAYNVTDWMMENMRKGIIQMIGNDKAGRVTFYVCTARDKPVAARREESRMNFDMFISYGTRLRPETKRCQITMLINQDKASMISNLDMTLQADIALRIAKFYPGCVDKIYICKMGRLLAAMAKPIFSRLPAIVSDRIIIISDGDIRHGKLLDLFDAEVLPVELGGKNDCNQQGNYDRFATTIRDYFEQLKAAILRGEGVKEWELNCLRSAGYIEEASRIDALKRSIIEPSISLRDQLSIAPHETGRYSPPGTNGTATAQCFTPRSPAYYALDVDDDANLITCGTDSIEMDGLYSPGLIQRNSLTMSRSPLRNLFTDYVNQFTTLESFFRISLTEMHERQWLQIVQWEMQERRTLLLENGLIQGDKLLAGLPSSVLLVAKGFLWLCLMVTSFYFLLGTCFIALLGVVTLINIFFAILVYPYHVFLYGTAFIVVASQFVIFCSRGFDVARSTFQGRVVQAFRAFGAKALAFQLVIYVGCTIAYFVLFCTMAARYDVLTGLQYSLAYGWIVAVCLIFIYHVLFAFGLRRLRKRSYAHGSRQNHAETTLYLFMEVEMDDEQMEQRFPPAEVMLLTMVAVLSVAMGVAFVTGGGFFFLCAAIVAQSVLLLLCATFTIARNVSSSSDIIICGVFYATVFWMSTLFTMSQHGWSGHWGSSLLASLFVMLFFVFTGLVSVYGRWKGAVRRWLFRISWLLLLLHLISCVAVLMVSNYRFGLFVLALAVHLLLCIVRTNEASNKYGVFTISACFTLVLLACCIIGRTSANDVYEGSVSDVFLPNYANRSSTPAAAGRLMLANLAEPPTRTSSMSRGSSVSAQGDTSYAMPPLCLTQFSPTVDVVGMALFTKLGLNRDVAGQDADLARWFPSFKRVPISEEVDSAAMSFDVFREETATVNTTIVTARPGSDLILLIESMAMWIDTYALSFFSFLMPAPYIDRVLPYLAFVQGMVPSRWEASIDKTTSVVRALLTKLRGDHEKVFVVGHGPVGSRAAVIGLRAQDNVHSIVFSGPPVILSKFNLNVTARVMARRMLSVQTMQTVFSTWYLRTASVQIIPCSLGGIQCDRIDATIEELRHLCSG